MNFIFLFAAMTVAGCVIGFFIENYASSSVDDWCYMFYGVGFVSLVILLIMIGVCVINNATATSDNCEMLETQKALEFKLEKADIRDEFGLLGIHLSKRHPQAPASYKGPITRTCYDLQSVVEQKPLSEYVLLRNIFDSISESENKASFTPDELRTAARAGIIDRNVIAEGGVSLENIEQVREWGFGGVAIRGDLWNHFDVHSQRDYKDLIAHFRKLRKAVG